MSDAPATGSDAVTLDEVRLALALTTPRRVEEVADPDGVDRLKAALAPDRPTDTA